LTVTALVERRIEVARNKKRKKKENEIKKRREKKRNSEVNK
jgi:hypothetical protein